MEQGYQEQELTKLKATARMTMLYPFQNHRDAFTLAELLVALTVTVVILTAVVTLAFALGTVNDSSSDTDLKQARLRYVTFRIQELIRNCRLICATPGTDVVIWRADDNNNDQININELVYIERGSGRNYLRFCEFTSATNPTIKLSWLEAFVTKWWLKYTCDVQYTRIIPACSNVNFTPDSSPPDSRFMSISFDLVENGTAHKYQITAALRSRAGNLLSDSEEITGDDD